MADVVVTGDEQGAELQQQSAHDAAVAQGAAGVHEEQAAEHAEQAAVAAEAALMAAAGNVETTQEAVEAGAVAQMAAADAAASRDAVLEAIGAQTGAITTLVEELRAGRPAPETPKDKPPAPDKPPVKKRRGAWYWGK